MKTCGKGHEYTTLKCSVCRSEYMANYRLSNADKMNAYHRERYKNSDVVAQKQEYRANTKSTRSAKAKIYREENKGPIAKANKTYRDKNSESIAQTNKKWREENPDQVRVNMQKWLEANPEKQRALLAKRRAAKLQATPPWYTHTDCVAIYKELKPGYHLDHIIPLQGENVSGLHWHHNLQLLPAAENLAKSNKFDPDTYVHELPFY